MISAHDLYKSLSGNVVLDDISLQLEDGQIIGLSGPSGSGKTTLMRLLAGLEMPDAGIIKIDGEIATDEKYCLAPHQRNIGFAFQSQALWPHMTIASNLQFAIAHGSRQSRNSLVQAIMEKVGIVELEHRFPNEISYGQAQRVSLARALIPKPRHLFLDEPFANLDLQTRSSLLGLVLEQNKTHGMSVLFVSHNVDEIKDLGGKHLHLMDSKLIDF